MNKLSKVFLIWMTLGLLSVAHAACQPLVKHYVSEFMIMLEEKATLSSEQQTAMRDTLRNSINAREDVIESYQGQSGLKAKRSLKKELDSVNAMLQSEAQTILDDEQYKAFLEVQEKTREEVKQRVTKMMDEK